MRAVFDTNILIDYLNGIADARDELNRFERRMISVITWMEIMVGASAGEDGILRAFLASFEVVALDDGIAEAAVRLRRDERIRLPDAIIWATARCRDAILVTRNVRDFPTGLPEIRIPYRVSPVR